MPSVSPRRNVLPSGEYISPQEALSVLKENQPRMWDDRKYELVIPGRPTRARRVSVGRPGITSEYLRSSLT